LASLYPRQSAPIDETDVAIIGGGPAGAAAALTLLRYTKHRVVLVEGTSYQFPRAGEMVSAAVVPLLDYLGASSRVATNDRIESFSHSASWGSPLVTTRDFMLTGRGHGWTLDRQHFDAALAGYVIELGGTLLVNTWLRSSAYENGRWLLQLAGDAYGQILASQVIDATGRRATFARSTGAQRTFYDRMVGVVSYFSLGDTAITQTTLVESVANGWWYSSALPNRRAIAAFMTDIDYLRSARLVSTTNFQAQLSATQHTQARLDIAQMEGRPHVFPAQSQILEPCIGPQWVAAGDAATAFDPLSSLGIGHALLSGIQAARIVDQRLERVEELAAAFANDVHQNFDTFLAQRQKLYSLERRWPESPFWRRREATASIG
jgi:flavin-dependent dehydrogenase